MYLGLLPKEFPGRDCVDWLPVDKVAPILIEILDSLEKSPGPADAPLPVYHVSNPNTTSWAALVEYVRGEVGLPKVAFATWLKHLEESSREFLQDVDKNPAIKLTDFYERISEGNSQVKLETSKAESASETLRSTGAVSASWVGRWMRQWGLTKMDLVVR